MAFNKMHFTYNSIFKKKPKIKIYQNCPKSILPDDFFLFRHIPIRYIPFTCHQNYRHFANLGQMNPVSRWQIREKKNSKVWYWISMISGAKYYYTKSCTKLRFYTRYNISLTMDYEKKSNTPTVLRPVEFSGRN